MPIADLEHMARCLRARYVLLVSARIRREYKLPEKFRQPALWKRIAENCHEVNAHPDVFIDAAFSECGRPEGPFANALVGDAARRWYERYCRQRAAQGVVNDPAESCMQSFEWCLGIIAEQLSDRIRRGEPEFEARHAIIGWPLFRFPAYVRVVLSYPIYPDIVQEYLTEAQEYFRANPTAATACAEKFPLLNELMQMHPDDPAE